MKVPKFILEERDVKMYYRNHLKEYSNFIDFTPKFVIDIFTRRTSAMISGLHS